MHLDALPVHLLSGVKTSYDLRYRRTEVVRVPGHVFEEYT